MCIIQQVFGMRRAEKHMEINLENFYKSCQHLKKKVNKKEITRLFDTMILRLLMDFNHEV